MEENRIEKFGEDHPILGCLLFLGIILGGCTLLGVCIGLILRIIKLFIY